MTSRILEWTALACWAAVLMLIAACGSNANDNAASGELAGVVLISGSAATPAGVHVSAGNVTADTGTDGRFSLPAVPAGERVVVTVKGQGYAQAFAVVTVRQNAQTSVVVHLVPVMFASPPFDPAAAQTFDVPGSTARVAFTADSLQAPGGAAVGGKVTAQITPIDPAADSRSMPGDYSTDAGARLESFGALHVSLVDGAGVRLNLKPGSTAAIRIPVPASSAVTAPATMALWSLNETSGRWVQEGKATLGGSGTNRYYEGTVGHFSYWNADAVADSVHVRGCVVDKNGSPVTGPDHVTVTAEGLDYLGPDNDNAVHLKKGQFDVVVKKFASAKIDAEVTGGLTLDDVGITSNAVIVSAQADDITLPTCLKLGDGSAAAPTIVQQPVDATIVAVGDLVVFQVVAAGGEPLTYQWRRDGVDIPGAVQREYVLEATVEQLTQEGADVDVVVKNKAGQTTSAKARLKVKSPGSLSFTKQPKTQSVTAGAKATFSGAVSGATSTLSYQWRRDGVVIPGATAASYTTPPLGVTDSGAVFSVVASTALNAITSDSATLTVLEAPPPPVDPAAPELTAQPANVTLAPGGQALFEVSATGNPVPNYQWRRNGTAIPGATSAVYLTPAVTVADNGAVFSVVVSNSQGTVTSNDASLSVATNAGFDVVHLVYGANQVGAGSVPLTLVADEKLVVQDTASLFVSGTFNATFNGAALPAVGSTLPTTGTLSAAFGDARTGSGAIYDGYTGSATIQYNVASPVNPTAPGGQPVNGTARLTSQQMHVVGSTNGSVMNIDYTSDGGATLSYTGTSGGPATDVGQTTVLTPDAGASLSEAASGLKATFAGGSITLQTVLTPLILKGSPTPLLVLSSFKVSYSALNFSIGGVMYVASGSYQFQPGAGSSPATGSGEVVITQGGAKVGRIFADAKGIHFDINGQVFDVQ